VLAVAGNEAVHLAIAVPAPVPEVIGATGAAWQEAAGFHVPVDVNVKKPEGTIAPVSAGITVAVNVTACVATLIGKSDVRVALVGPAMTTCGNTGDVVAAKLGSPL
jgi:hypothetical protein